MNNQQQQQQVNTTLSIEDILGEAPVKDLIEDMKTPVVVASTIDVVQYNDVLSKVKSRFPDHDFEPSIIRYRKRRRHDIPQSIENLQKKIELMKREQKELESLKKYDDSLYKLHEEYSLVKKLSNSSGRSKRKYETMEDDTVNLQ